MRACPGDGGTGGAMMRMSRPQPEASFSVNPVLEHDAGFRRSSPSDGGQARKPRPDIESAKEVGCVKRSQALVVRCECSSTGKSLACLLEESFRLYLARILASPDGHKGSCGR